MTTRILSGIVLFCFFLNQAAWAISESNYSQHFSLDVVPYFKNPVWVDGEFSGKAGVPIRYRKLELSSDQEKAALVIIPGRTQPFLQYAELAYDLKDQGFSIYFIDPRGQGLSGRMTRDPQVGYVRHFEDYVDDLDAFMSGVVNKVHHRKTFVIAHSMGAGIAAYYDELHPGHFNAMTLVSPMIEIQTGGFPRPIAELMVFFACLFGFGKSYSVGQTSFDAHFPFEQSSTQSPARFAAEMNVFSEFPQTRLGGASSRWVKEVFALTSKVQSRASKLAEPILVLEAGKDTLVTKSGVDQFCKVAKKCRSVFYPNARHEILFEKDEFRNDALKQIKDFLN
jgi:lysophospholipase